MIILGISGLYHDSAATLIRDGEILCAIQEERLTRIKHDPRFPVHAIRYCMDSNGLKPSQINSIVFYDNPLLTLDRYIKNIAAAGKDSDELIESGYRSVFSEKLWVHKLIQDVMDSCGGGFEGKILICKHHVSHAASAFYPSPFEKAVVITIDGVGEWETTTIGVGVGSGLKIKEMIHYPHSLGLLYSAFTYFCGFKVNSGDYKFMGLAPYGEPIYEDIIRNKIINIKKDGSYRLNLDYFDFQYGRTMTNDKFADLFGGSRREPESRITKREMDIAASAQKVIEDVILRIVSHAKKEYGAEIDNLALAGGVALNCVANGKIKNANLFKNIWIQPAAGDAGGSLGCALFAYYNYYGQQRVVNLNDSQKNSFLGVSYTSKEVQEYLDRNGYPYHQFGEERLYGQIADELSKSKVVGLFQGRMEFGPRALGGRSILADPRSDEMQVKLNIKIKYRESFRPFAPSVLLEDVSEYFELDSESPYMLIVEDVRKNRQIKCEWSEKLESCNYDMLEVVKQRRSDIPAVTHVDYSARIQTVSEERNGYYYKVLKAFEKLTGCGVIVNTSFNIRGEPIVCTLQNAYECFMRTEMDVLVLEDCILYKEEQPNWNETEDWRSKYELD